MIKKETSEMNVSVKGGEMMKLEEYKSSELALELLHRKDVKSMFVESDEVITLTVDGSEGAAMILICKTQIVWWQILLLYEYDRVL